jgi:tryptophanyl-tRNA synthetase
VAGKGILNRAHAYKAAVDRNREAGEDDDAGITAGLFMYPVLMAADILIFNAHKVPVGRDQIQHIEMARDFGQRFNHLYGEHFTLPEVTIAENVATLPGLDGRKMSKSYDNVIPLFAPREQLKKLIYSIVTDSRAPGEPKDADASNVFQLYQAFASAEQAAEMRRAFESGIAWGEAKQALFERIDAEIAPMRETYEALIAKPQEIEAVLRDGAARLRARHATPLLARLREAVGLRDLSGLAAPRGATGHVDGAGTAARGSSNALFKQYREPDGKFYFKLVRGERVLLQSVGFDAPRDAGQRVAALKQAGRLDDEAAAMLAEGVTRDEVDAALAAMAEADA